MPNTLNMQMMLVPADKFLIYKCGGTKFHHLIQLSAIAS